jgi:hypothetical protein
MRGAKWGLSLHRAEVVGGGGAGDCTCAAGSHLFDPAGRVRAVLLCSGVGRP